MVGGQFEIDYTVRNTDALDDLGTAFIHVKPASPSFFSGLDALTAVQPGNAALVAFADDHVIDVLHLQLVQPTDLELVHEGIENPAIVEVELGTSVTIEAYATSVTCSAGGGLPVSAVSSDSAVASVGGTGLVTVQGNDEGDAEIVVTVGEMTRALLVRVVPAVDPTEETLGPTTSDTAGTTTAADSGTDTGSTDDGSSTDGGSEGGSSEGGTDTGTDGGSTDGSTGTGS
jgi:hypothetical protein